MGVHGLWSLVSPVARPITLESLQGKRLAVDASIWLYQFQMAMRDRKTGDTLHGAHIMGTFRRIMKLLFHGIKPVFVFDGDAPMLKKRTIEKRKRRKQGAGRDLAKTAQQLLAQQLRAAVAERELNKRRQGTADDADTGEPIGADAVYLEDLEKATSPVKSARKDALRDDYALPKIEGPLEKRAKMSDPRIATEEELREFIEDLRPEDLDIESDFFAGLPTEVKYEIIGDLRIKTRQVNHRRVQQMRGTAAIDFSRAQIDNLMERNSYTQKLLSVTDELGKSAIAIPTRVAGSRNREYILVKQDANKGGGWVLGVKNPEMASNEPITLDTTTDESVGTHTDTDEFEEVVASPDRKVGLPTPDVDARRILAEEAVRARFAPQQPRPAADPYLDLPVASTSSASGLFQRDTLPDEADPALQQALYDSAQASASSNLPNPLAVASTSKAAFSISSLNQHSAGFIPSASNPVVQHPPQPGAANDTDDDLEYVDPPPHSKGKGKATPPPAAAPQADQPSATGPVRATHGATTDDEGSDAFEDVAPAPLSRHASKVPPDSASAPHTPPAPPLDDMSAPQRLSPPPPPAPAPANRTLIDAVLLSDSESEAEASPPKPPPRPLAPPQPAPSTTFSRLSPSPDPFERFEQPATGVHALDFAPVAPPAPGSSPGHPLPPPQPTPPPAAESESDLLALPPVSPDPPRALRLAQRVSGLPSGDVRAPSPVNMPAPLPPLEKAQEAIQAEEAGVLAETVAQLPSPKLPSPPPAAFDSLERGTLEGEARTGVSKEMPTEVDVAREEVGAGRATASGDAGQAAKGSAAEADEELFFSDWSRSPSPPPSHRRESAVAAEGDSPALVDDGEWVYEANEEEEAEAAAAIEREADAYVDMMAQLRNGRIEEMRAEAEKEILRLSEQRNTEMRNADGITRQMALDIKEMLILFGIPYVDAPMEAEAECASLMTRALVDGIVTDDSDVFLFGGARIYRNMFNESKYVECYLAADLEREIGLDRGKLVRLAYLLGSDYTEGLPGVGPVAGRELLEEFPGDDGLKRFAAWWDRVQNGKDSQLDTNTDWKRRFKKGHRELVLESNWPNPEVAHAYYRPTVEESNDPFSWGLVDLDGLRLYLARSLGWDQTKTDSILLPLIKREQERKEGRHGQQKRVTDFFDLTAGYEPFSRKKQPKYASKRLQNVVQAWKDKSQPSKDEADEEPEEEAPAPKPKKKRAAKGSTTPKAPQAKKSTAATRKRSAKQARDVRAAANDGVYSSDEDLESDWEKEQGSRSGSSGRNKARTQPARSKRRKVVVPQDEEDGLVEDE